MFPINGDVKSRVIPARARQLANRLFVIGHDVLMAAASFAISAWLRLGDEAGAWLSGPLLPAWALFTVCCVGVFWASGMSRGVWRYTSINDMIVIARAVSLAILVYCLFTFVVTRLDAVPRSTLVINWLVLAVLIAAPRLACRMYNNGGLRQIWHSNGPGTSLPIILIGTGRSAELFIRSIAHDPTAPYCVLGLVDEEGSNIGLSIHGRPVLGRVADLPSILENLKQRGITPHHFILTRPLQRKLMQDVMEVAESEGVSVARLPRLTEFKKGASEEIQIEPIAVEDLLGRTQAKLDQDNVQQYVTGQRVLVTGAGGSIGSELARQIAAMSPAHLSLLDASETLLYAIDSQIGELFPDMSRSAVIADVRDRSRQRQVMLDERPALVFHAAALKHVPLVEGNQIEGVLTNAIGTRNVADACYYAGVKAMVMISTDKAVNPASTMGATKRLAEQYCQALNEAKTGPADMSPFIKNDLGARRGPRYITVRFGNVLGSNGSVVPLFKRQLAAGGPLTVTHPEMTRYFMTSTEAVELVLQAMATGLQHPDDDRGSIYVLDMGKPVKILDLAHLVIRLSGLKPGEDIEIKITGTRPGEKLTEELFHDSEILRPTEHPSLRLASPRHANLETVSGYLNVLEDACRQHQHDMVMWYLKKFVPEFQVDVSDQPVIAQPYLTSAIAPFWPNLQSERVLKAEGE